MDLQEAVKRNDVAEVRRIMAEHDLVLRDGKIVPRDDDAKAALQALSEFYDQRQLAKKITLNATYGALLNEMCKFYDARIGQSTTLCGRSIVKHMNAQINCEIAGIYDHVGDAIVYADTDSVAADSIIHTDAGKMTVEKLFEACQIRWSDGEKQYAADERIKVCGYDPQQASVTQDVPAFIYRHRVRKRRFRITGDSGNSVVVTEDHSIMAERAARLVEVKPTGLRLGDTMIGLSPRYVVVEFVGRKTQVTKIEELEPFDGEYVYDIGVTPDRPYFFANDILVHNSCYYSAAEYLTTQRASGKPSDGVLSLEDIETLLASRDSTIAFYDHVAEAANATFPAFMAKTFNTSLERGALIKAGRELVGSTGLWVKRKKYAIMVYDKEGKRQDVDGKPGSLKVMGLDLKRADTPKFMQQFLESFLRDLLCGVSKERLYQDIRSFRTAFKGRPAWEKGSPKKVSNLTGYLDKVKTSNRIKVGERLPAGQKLKVAMPGHVLASANWNKLRNLNGDRYSTEITDGARIVVCKLRPNVHGFSSVAYPVDEPHLPQWFRDLPFDDAAMEQVIVDQKLNNLVGVLPDWNLADTVEREGDEFFVFG